MINKIYLNQGEKVLHRDKPVIIIRVISIREVSIEEIHTNIIRTVSISDLAPYTQEKVSQKRDFSMLSDIQWDKAQNRYNIILPLLTDRGNLELVKEVASNNNVSIPTIYRWLKKFDESGLVSSLSDKERTGGVGKSRLLTIQEDIIQDKINLVYLTKSRKSIIKTIREIQIACHDLGIKPPHENTVRKRIKSINEESKLRARYGIQEARYKFEPIKSSFPGADFPLSVVQIDHTPVDIILVDEQSREPLSRPWLTLAIDVYSRIVVGFYLAFETPGALGTGICIANSILPKEQWLLDRNINSDWPIWGVMKKIHVDNAKEFKGKMLKNACIEYGIDLEFRPVGTPHYGGHVERLLGVFSKEIHNLPGTTFSSSEERKRYNSKKNASFTLKEFEKWLTIYITKVYHNRIHSGINTTPLDKFKQGILGDKNTPGIGMPPRIMNRRKVELDFMPLIERSIQEYGVVIDHIYYYSDVLRNYIHDSDSKGNKIKHKFKRDPRDISVIYFYDYKQNTYYEIPYRNSSQPPITIWEHRLILAKLKENKIHINEESIFEAYRELNEIESKVIRETRKTKKVKKNKLIMPVNITDFEDEQEIINESNNILPFEDIDDEAYNR